MLPYSINSDNIRRSKLPLHLLRCYCSLCDQQHAPQCTEIAKGYSFALKNSGFPKNTYKKYLQDSIIASYRYPSSALFKYVIGCFPPASPYKISTSCSITGFPAF